MQAKYSIYLGYYRPINRLGLNSFAENVSALEFNEERGYGFKDISLEGTYLTATLFKRNPVFISDFDPLTLQITKRQIFLFEEIDFAMDGKREMLEVYGASKAIPKLRSTIATALPQNIREEAVDTAPWRFIPGLLAYGGDILIERLIIQNFRYREAGVGKYEISIDNQVTALQLLAEYEYNVTKARFQLQLPGFPEVEIEASTSSRLVIKCAEKIFYELLDLVKDVLVVNHQKN